jgi:hypothetical protein
MSVSKKLPLAKRKMDQQNSRKSISKKSRKSPESTKFYTAHLNLLSEGCHLATRQGISLLNVVMIELPSLEASLISLIPKEVSQSSQIQMTKSFNSKTRSWSYCSKTKTSCSSAYKCLEEIKFQLPWVSWTKTKTLQWSTTWQTTSTSSTTIGKGRCTETSGSSLNQHISDDSMALLK